MKKPNSRRNLDVAIERAFGRGRSFTRARATIANVIVGQMLPDGAVKGGSSIKLRLGEGATRYTTDLDVARASDLEDWIARLRSSLAEGWEGFTGRVVTREPASPEGVPAAYVMQPFAVKLDYNGKPWVTVDLEVGHNEIGDADEPDLCLPRFVVEAFESIGLPSPGPVPLMPVSHQIAQKLHGLSEPGSNCAGFPRWTATCGTSPLYSYHWHADHPSGLLCDRQLVAATATVGLAGRHAFAIRETFPCHS